jgi:ABC-2 type transport system permease protein
MGWAILTMALAQIMQLLGWGSWFPWAVPALFTMLGDPRAADLGPHSYLVVGVTCLVGLAATFAWWQRADQSR